MIRINEGKREKCRLDENKERKKKTFIIPILHLNKLCNLIRAQKMNCLNV